MVSLCEITTMYNASLIISTKNINLLQVIFLVKHLKEFKQSTKHEKTANLNSKYCKPNQTIITFHRPGITKKFFFFSNKNDNNGMSHSTLLSIFYVHIKNHIFLRTKQVRNISLSLRSTPL